jgi:hypothetical protein
MDSDSKVAVLEREMEGLKVRLSELEGLVKSVLRKKKKGKKHGRRDRDERVIRVKSDRSQRSSEGMRMSQWSSRDGDEGT